MPDKSTKKQSKTLRQFQLFIRKRNHNNQLLRSDHESITTKVNCFQQLITLTRTGKTLPLTHSTPQHQSIKHFSAKVIEPQEPEENSDFLIGRFNKMAKQLRSWETSKEHSQHSPPPAHRQSGPYLKPKKNKIQSKSTNISRVCKKEEPKQLSNLQDEAKWLLESHKAQPYPFKKKSRGQAFRQTSSKPTHNYHLSTPNLCSSMGNENFQNLKREIKDLEHKAKQNYGISFGSYQPQIVEQEEEEDLQPQKKDMIRLVSTAQPRRVGDQNYLRLKNQHLQQDSSIPARFLGIIKKKYGIKRPYTQENSFRYIRV